MHILKIQARIVRFLQIVQNLYIVSSCDDEAYAVKLVRLHLSYGDDLSITLFVPLLLDGLLVDLEFPSLILPLPRLESISHASAVCLYCPAARQVLI